ncbi:MAG: type VI secretion system tube protein Hcp [Saprospiraceae bacterium]|nr:type VI secretion system tube protein Hcp [Saprospiraceae bacterium]
MRITCLFAIVLSSLMVRAQVGIGTTTPSTNSALDVTSPNKGLMLPRLTDTSTVSNPSAGLMIYDMNAAAPSFHNGVKWNSVASSSSQMMMNDSITYTIANPARMLGFVAGTYPVQSFSNGASNSGMESSVQDMSFSKSMDQNSIPFSRAVVQSADLSSMTIEFKVYNPGASDPYYSIKLTGGEVSSTAMGISNQDMMLNEFVSITPNIIGFKNWTNNQSYAYNIATMQFVPY